MNWNWNLWIDLGRKRETKGICQHNRIRSQCKECGGGSICQHNRQRYQCKECGGEGICQHGRQRSMCKTCKADKDEFMPPDLKVL